MLIASDGEAMSASRCKSDGRGMDGMEGNDGIVLHSERSHAYG